MHFITGRKAKKIARLLICFLFSFSVDAEEIAHKEAIEEVLKNYEEELRDQPENTSLLYALGKAYYNQGNYNRAIGLFKRVLVLEPDNQEAELFLGLAYLFTDRIETSRKFLEKIAPNFPENPDVLAAMGRIRQFHYQFKEAENCYRKALEIDPGNTMALTFLGSLKLEQREFFSALKIFKEIEKKEPDSKWVKQDLLKARLGPDIESIKQLVDEGKYENAAARYEALLSEHRDFLDLYLLLGDVYVKMDKFNKAQSLYEQALALHLEPLPLLNAMGFAYLREGNLTESEKQFYKVLQKDSQNPDALAGMGKIALERGRIKEAEVFFQESLRNKPFNLTTLIYLAKFQTDQKHYKDALETYHKILKVLPDQEWVKDAIYQAEYGKALDLIEQKEKQKEYKAAEELYKDLIKQSPENIEFYDQFGNFYFRLKNYPKAIAVYRKALNIDSQSISTLTGLGFAYLANKEINKSENIFIQIQDLDPKNSNALVGLGAIAEYDENFKNAEMFYSKALKTDPFNENALLYLGKFKLKEGKDKAAERLFKKIKDLNPDAEWINQLILDAKNSPILKAIKENEERGRNHIAEQLYLKLLRDSPQVPSYYLSLGSFYIKRKRFQDAEEIYLKGLKNNPGSLPLTTALGFVYLKKNQIKSARKLFQTVLKNESGNSEALTGLGAILQREKHFAGAEKLFLKALTSEPDNITALTYLAELYLETEQNEKAMKIYDKLLVLLPNEEWVEFAAEDIQHAALLKEVLDLENTELLSEEEKNSNFEQAAVLLRKLVKEAPDNPNYALRLGQLLGKMKRFSEALSVYEQGLVYHPKDIFLKIAVGYTYVYLEDYEKAEREFNSILDTHPENADALAGLGRIKDLTGKPNDAWSYYREALALDPYNINALSFLAALNMEEKHYKEAREIYERLSTLKPGSEWIEKALKETDISPYMDQIRGLEQNGQLEKASEIYNRILSQVDDVDYYLGLGNLYVRMEQYSKAIEVFKQGLNKNSGSPNLIAAIGIAYVLDRNIKQAKYWLDEARNATPQNAEVLAGLGRIEFLQGNMSKAETLYRSALEHSPDNTSALSFYGELLMKQKRYEEAVQIYTRLHELEPESAWVSEAIIQAKTGPQMDGARVLVELGEWGRAKREYFKLFSISSKVPDYYLSLGDLYFAKDWFNTAIRIYRLGLIADPNSKSLWRAIAFAYLSKWNLGESTRIFNCLLSKDSNDADSWAGLGRVWALRGCYDTSLAYFSHAFDIDSNNETALAYMAQGEADQEHFFSAKSLYKKLYRLNPGDSWIQDRLSFLNMITHPSVNFLGKYYEEDEWDRNVDEWVARYQVYGYGVRIDCPMNNRLRFSGYARQDYYKLVNREDEFTYYFFDVIRSYAESRWRVSPCLFVDANLGVTGYSPYRSEAFSQKNGTVIEPTLLFTWHRPRTRSIFGFSSDTDLVARDFNNNRAQMVTRYYVTEHLEHDFLETLSAGLEGGYYYLNGFRDNDFQRAAAFAAWRPEPFKDWLTIHYFFQYQNFNQVISDYYTYAPQLVNHLQFEFNKRWDGVGYIRAGYAHGWQNTRTRFAQIIINQPPILQPFFWDRRDYNSCFIQAAYDQCPLKLAVEGSFYRDSKKYTIWYTDISLGWIF